nr:MFS transporter [Actinomyces gerencseriae]
MLTVQVVFVTQNLNITPVHLGFALTCGAMLGLVAGVALGAWSDGRNLRRLMPALGVVQAVAAAGYLVSTSPVLLGVMVGAVSIAGRGGAAVRGPFMAAMVGRERLVTYRATVRSVANAAMAVGAALGGVALGYASPTAATIAMGAVPVGHLLGAALTASVSLPYASAPRGSAEGGKTESSPRTPAIASVPVMKNSRFLMVVGLSAILMTHVPMLSVAFPL